MINEMSKAKGFCVSMQDSGSSVHSCHEAFEIGNGSSSSNDQELCWNNNRNPRISRDLQGYCLSTSNLVSMPCIDGATNLGSSLNSVSLSASGTSRHSRDQRDHDGHKMDSNWGSSLTMQPLSLRLLQAGSLSNGCGSLTLHRNLPTVPLGHLNFDLRDSSTPQSSDINVGHIFTDIQAVADGVGRSSQYKPLSSVARKIPFTCSDHGESSSGTSLDLLAESDVLSCCPMDKRRTSCKRKSLETLTGQPSHAHSSLQQEENNVCPSLPSPGNQAPTISVSLLPPSSVGSLQEQTRIGGGSSIASGYHLSVANDTGICQRNSRSRIAPVSPEDTLPTGVPNASDSVRNASLLRPTNGVVFQSYRTLDLTPHLGTSSSSPNQSNVLHHPNSRVSNSVGPLDLRPLVGNSISTHYQSSGLYLPAHHQHFLASEGNATTNSRTAAISSMQLADISEHASSMLPRNISDRISETQLYNQDTLNWVSDNENGLTNTSSIPVPSSSSGPYPTATWTPNMLASEHLPNRLAEVSGLLLPSSSPNSGAQVGSFPPPHSFSAIPSSDVLPPSGSAIQRHGRQHMQSPFLMDRARGTILGLPLSSRNHTAFDGRMRLVSEIRGVLNRIHRGSFNFEDFFILDQAVSGGRSELRDRHRDLRLDVDNMSYEELLALEERIGNVSTGLNEDTISKCLKQSKYSLSNTEQEAFDVEPCCICQEDYVDDEPLGTLDCGHFFHVICIKQWLVHKNLCPICKTTGLVTT